MFFGLFGKGKSTPKKRVVVYVQRGPDGRLRATYDGAQTTDWNKRHWSHVDELSANASMSVAVRNTVRKRARYEVASNPFLRGIVGTLANWTVGRGPLLDLKGTGDNDAVTRIEDRFHKWARWVRLARKLWTMRVAKAVDGEVFALLTANPKVPGDVQLDIKLVECDRVRTPNFWAWKAGPYTTSGIICDEHGNPVTYHVLKHHPGNDYGGSASDVEEIPAEQMIHLFRMDRPGQTRGISEILPSLDAAAALRRFSDATLAAAEIAADHAVLLETEAPADEDAAEEYAEFSEAEISRGLMTMLPYGTKAVQIKPEHPSTVYHEYFRDKINEIARPLDMPLNIALGNSEDFNYASGRLDHQTFQKAIKVEQEDVFELGALNLRVLPNWLREDKLGHREDYRAAGSLSATWYWTEQEHVDPLKEARAQDIELKNGSATLARAYARKGANWEREDRQLQIERVRKLENDVDLAKRRKELLEKNGLTDADLASVRESGSKPAASDSGRDDPDEDEDK